MAAAILCWKHLLQFKEKEEGIRIKFLSPRLKYQAKEKPINLASSPPFYGFPVSNVYNLFHPRFEPPKIIRWRKPFRNLSSRRGQFRQHFTTTFALNDLRCFFGVVQAGFLTFLAFWSLKSKKFPWTTKVSMVPLMDPWIPVKELLKG